MLNKARGADGETTMREIAAHAEDGPATLRMAGVTAVPPVREGAPVAFLGHAPRGPVCAATEVRCFEEYVDVFGGLCAESTMGHAVRHFFINGGSRALIVRVVGDRRAAIDGGAESLPSEREYRGDRACGSGLHALDAVERFSLLCVPPMTDEKGTPRDFTARFWNAAIEYCRGRGAMVIVNPGTAWRTARDVAQAALPDDPNALLYYPDILAADPLRDGAVREHAPCGVAAGVIARTERRRGIWRAPAGLDARMNGVSATAVNVSDEENRALAALGVNVLRSLPVAGMVIWGARTLTRADRADDSWKYLPARRLALEVECELRRRMRWAANRRNDSTLWAQLRADAEEYLRGLYLAGALRGTTTSDAYAVRCDPLASRSEAAGRGVAVIIVGIAPLQAGRFVWLNVEIPVHGDRSPRTRPSA